MIYINNNVLMPNNFTQIRIYPIHNPKPLLDPFISQFLVKDMLELGLLMQLPKDVVRGRNPHDELSD